VVAAVRSPSRTAAIRAATLAGTAQLIAIGRAADTQS
jgi:hypothetical protein